MSQASEILARLRAGEVITPRDAFARHGTLALHSVIAELRRRIEPGLEIACELKTKGSKRWGEYRLVRSAADPRQTDLFTFGSAADRVALQKDEAPHEAGPSPGL